MDISSLTITIPVAIALGSGIIGILTFFGNRRKQDKNEEARLVRMETMLVQIEKNTNSLNTRVDNHDHLLTKHETRLSVIETKIKGKGGN